ncbi:NADH-quinone oxidoreductase subunit C [Streptomyces sp. NPDC057287]|uniref:NADH-quinone oxidoreductase subunit C n=1 Tax=Streptomyces sp. NPDC057287 TaxID=3346086 RepID=UPI0036334219
MTAEETYDRLPDAVADVFGADATATHAYDLLTVDVPAASWTAALETARDELGCTYFDWLSAVDEPGTGFRVCAHVAALGDGTVRRLLLRTTVPHDAATLPTAVGVYAGAGWHERETHEMFGIAFENHPHLVPLLLPESFEGHPLRKDFVLAARVAKAWPGAKEPGESEHGGPKRRTMLPPGVPDPNEWGPLKGQLPPAPARPARGARAAGDRPVRRARSASEGSAAQRPDAEETPQTAPPRRSRSASQGSASQATDPAAVPPASAPPSSASPASAPPVATPPEATPSGDATENGATENGPAQSGGGPRATGAAGSSDAPWHDARPAFDEAPKRPAEPASSEPAEPAPAPSEPAESTSEQPAEPARADPDAQDDAGRDPAPDAQDDAGREPDRDPEPGPDHPPDSGPGRDTGPDSDGPDPDASSRSDRSAGPDRPAGGDTA